MEIEEYLKESIEEFKEDLEKKYKEEYPNKGEFTNNSGHNSKIRRW